MIDESRDCTRCGAVLGELDELDELCPSCLLHHGLSEDHQEDTTPEALGAIGPLRLLEVVGEGGMGIVYRARQVGALDRVVAVKVLRPGLATREVLARFDAERFALATFDHPNIATIYDAGETDDCRPYFAMEYVAGPRITKYCDDERLAIADRLRIFVKVCRAVQHAHDRGFIHRDLKPSNLLVSIAGPEPEPKVIDFGIAKAVEKRLTERTLSTRRGILIGTPEYMSPEQAALSGADVDHTTDVYSLGIVLYELLTGLLPFDAEQLRKEGYLAIERAIRETEPPKPSSRIVEAGSKARVLGRRRRARGTQLARALRGNLDWIVLKALEKDPLKRYASAGELADDVSHHLCHEAIVAGPPTVLRRVARLSRQHQGWITFILLIGLGLPAGFFGVRWLSSSLMNGQPKTKFGYSQCLLPDGRIVDGPLLRRLLADSTGFGRAADVREIESVSLGGLVIAGDRGVVFLGGTGQELRRFALPERSSVEVVDVDADNSPEFLTVANGAVQLVSSTGLTIWSYSPPGSWAVDAAAGDLDGDGMHEFVVSFSASEGVHMLESDGALVWKDGSFNAKQLEVANVRKDERPEILQTNAQGRLGVRTLGGELVKEVRPRPIIQPFSLFGASEPDGYQLIFFNRFGHGLVIATAAGRVVRQLSTGQPKLAAFEHARGATVRFTPSGPTFIVALVYASDSSCSAVLLLYDESERILYRENLNGGERTLRVATDPQSGAQRVLVGGEGVVWEYKWDEGFYTPGGPQQPRAALSLSE